MHKIRVLIEENIAGAARPVEVVADVPAVMLVPALVEELQLPQTDLFGERLLYALRRSGAQKSIPANSTLLDVGVQSGECLALEAITPDVAGGEAGGTPLQKDASFYSSATIANNIPVELLAQAASASGALKRERKWPRRAFLGVLGTVLATTGAMSGYAAYRLYGGDTKGTAAITPSPRQQPQQQPTAPPTATVPTRLEQTFSFERHQQNVRVVAWSPDGQVLASGADDRHVYIWNKDGVISQDLVHPSAVHALAWAPDSQRVVTAERDIVTFLRVANGEVLSRSGRHAQAVNALAWTSQGQMQAVSAAQDKQAIVWNTTTYQPQALYTRHTSPILAACWDSSGQYVATGTQGGTIRVWNAANPQQELHGPYVLPVPVRALAFSSQGKLAVGGNDGGVRVWNGLTCQVQQTAKLANQCIDDPIVIQLTNSPVRSLAWSADGKYLAFVTQNSMIAIWSLEQQRILVKAQGEGTMRSVSWSPLGDFLATVAGKKVLIWHVL